MQGNFTFCNPTKLHFGKDALNNLGDELKNYGPKVMLTYGGGSIKKNGIYDQVVAVLKEAGKTIVKMSGVMPNPTIEKLYEGAALAKEEAVDLILAVGGGSTCDYSKAVAASAYCEEDPWQKYYLRQEEPECKIIPVACVLTMAGTGSEMNTGAVITNHTQKLKIGKVFQNAELFPRFTILNPEFTYSLPKYQMVAGIYDIFNHICEQYFSGDDDNTSDYIAEGLMRSVVAASRKAIVNQEDYEARSNIMWCATWALNTLISRGKSTDWMVHMIGQAAGGVTNGTHGHCLAAVSLAYYRTQMEAGVKKFARFAECVWGISRDGRSDMEMAEAGLAAMEAWMKDLGLAMNLTTLGATPDMVDDIVNGTFILTGGYKVLTKEEVKDVVLKSM